MRDAITIKGIKYLVEAVVTVDDMLEKGHKAVAAMMRDNHITSHLVLRRPKGRVDYLAYQYDHGTCAVITSL